MIVHKAHEINVAVRLVDAPAFAHKAEIDVSCRSPASFAFVQDIDTLECFLVPRYAQLRLCMPPYDAFLLLAPDGDNSRVIRALRVVELADPQRESAIFEVEREWTEANWINIVEYSKL
jgi:hypothetical protein